MSQPAKEQEAKKPAEKPLSFASKAFKDWLSLMVGEANEGGNHEFVKIEEWATNSEGRILGVAGASVALLLPVLGGVSLYVGKAKLTPDKFLIVAYILLIGVIGALLIAKPLSLVCQRQVSTRVLAFIIIGTVTPTLPLIGLVTILGATQNTLLVILGAFVGLMALMLGPLRATVATRRYLGGLKCPKHGLPADCPKSCGTRLTVLYWFLALIAWAVYLSIVTALRG